MFTSILIIGLSIAVIIMLAGLFAVVISHRKRFKDSELYQPHLKRREARMLEGKA